MSSNYLYYSTLHSYALVVTTRKTLVAVMVFTLTSCSGMNQLNNENNVGTWEVFKIYKPQKNSKETDLNTNKSDYLITKLFKRNDQWVFEKNNTLTHIGKLDIWPHLKTYPLKNNMLYFYLSNLEDYNRYATFCTV